LLPDLASQIDLSQIGKKNGDPAKWRYSTLGFS